MLSFPDQSTNIDEAMRVAYGMMMRHRDEFFTPEILLWAISQQRQFMMVVNSARLHGKLIQYIDKYSTTVPDGIPYVEPEISWQMGKIIQNVIMQLAMSNAKNTDVPHLLQAILSLDNSYAKDILIAAFDGNVSQCMAEIIDNYSDHTLDYKPVYRNNGMSVDKDSGENVESPEFPDDDFDIEFPYYESDDIFATSSNDGWESYVTCMNDIVDRQNPLVGRRQELDRTIQILCRKDKNNPLHVGEAGVGKTALAYGLAARIVKGDVPDRLKNAQIYELDLGALMAGTQYRGEMEKRIKNVLNALEQKGNVILYVDEIHNLIGAGRVEGGTLDISNLLKRSLEQGDIRFMGATTYDEYNKTFLRSKGFARRFEKVDVGEPTVDQCIEIIKGIKSRYEDFHKVRFTPEAVDTAVRGADKYINGRFLPDKAIDLIDEAGAWAQINGDKDDEGVATVDSAIISEVLAKICHVETLTENSNDIDRLNNLESQLKSQIFNQDKAIGEVTEAVLMGSAGLLDDNKPMASLLFVGPTGVGKTEVAKVLAAQLGLPLLRFDMSEYAEKHTVAKLIGSPAGYVGYEDGGLLTDAIRKSPHCVLLFDELEKAHEDIYNILLQVMDYASLTDNKGNKADFRHVIFIMTTNAGAQDARQAGLGFVKGQRAGEVMMKSVKKTFKPEFLNRLTAVTIFNDMDRDMARLILDKKLRLLELKLNNKNVTLSLDDKAHELLLNEGFSHEYGGREIDRVLNNRLKPLLMRAMLFGSLSDGGEARVSVNDAGDLTLAD